MSISVEGIAISSETINKVFLFGHQQSGKSLIREALSTSLYSNPYFERDPSSIPTIVEFTNPSMKLEVLYPVIFPRASVYVISFSIMRFLSALSAKNSSSTPRTPPAVPNRTNSASAKALFADFFELIERYVGLFDTTVNPRIAFVGTYSEEEEGRLIEKAQKRTLSEVFHLINAKLSQYLVRFKLSDSILILSENNFNFHPFSHKKKESRKEHRIFSVRAPSTIGLSSVQRIAKSIDHYFQSLTSIYQQGLPSSPRNEFHSFAFNWRGYDNDAIDAVPYSQWLELLQVHYHWSSGEAAMAAAERLTKRMIADRLILSVQERRRVQPDRLSEEQYFSTQRTMIILKPLTCLSKMPFDVLNSRKTPPSPLLIREDSSSSSSSLFQLQLPRSNSSGLITMLRRSSSQISLDRVGSSTSLASSSTTSTATTSNHLPSSTTTFRNSFEAISADLTYPLEQEYFNKYGYLSSLFFQRKKCSSVLIDLLQQLGILSPVGEGQLVLQRTGGGRGLVEPEEEGEAVYRQYRSHHSPRLADLFSLPQRFYSIFPFSLSSSTEFSPVKEAKFSIYLGLVDRLARRNSSSLEVTTDNYCRHFPSFPGLFHQYLLSNLLSRHYSLSAAFEIHIEPLDNYHLHHRHLCSIHFLTRLTSTRLEEAGEEEQQIVCLQYLPQQRLYRLDFTRHLPSIPSKWILQWLLERFEEVLSRFPRRLAREELKIWLPLHQSHERSSSSIPFTALVDIHLQIEQWSQEYHLSDRKREALWQREFAFPWVKRYGLLLPYLAEYLHRFFDFPSSLSTKDALLCSWRRMHAQTRRLKRIGRRRGQSSVLREEEEEELEEEDRDFLELQRETTATLIHETFHSRNALQENLVERQFWLQSYSSIPIFSHCSRHFCLLLSSSSQIQTSLVSYLQEIGSLKQQQSRPQQYHRLGFLTVRHREKTRSLFQELTRTHAILLVYDLQEWQQGELLPSFCLEWWLLSSLSTVFSEISHLQRIKVFLIDNILTEGLGLDFADLDYFHQLFFQMVSEEQRAAIAMPPILQEGRAILRDYLERIEQDYLLDAPLRRRYEQMLEAAETAVSVEDIVRGFSYLLGSMKSSRPERRTIEVIAAQAIPQLDSTRDHRISAQFSSLLTGYNSARPFPFPKHKTFLKRCIQFHRMLLDCLLGFFFLTLLFFLFGGEI